MRIAWKLGVAALMATACARAPEALQGPPHVAASQGTAESPNPVAAPRTQLEIARIDDSTDVFPGLAVETIPRRGGIAVFSEYVPLGDGAAREHQFARLDLSDGESREAAIRRFRAWLETTVRLSERAPPDALRSFVIVGAPILRTEDVLEAVATRSPDDGHAYVVLTLSPRGAESLETATDAWLGRRIAIMIDGHVESAPVIRSKISSGSVSITIGAGDSPTRMAEARKLARGLAVRH